MTERAAKAAEEAVKGVGRIAKPNFQPLNDNSTAAQGTK